MLYQPYIGIKLVARKCFVLKIATMNLICTGYKMCFMKTIIKLINKTKQTTFPYQNEDEDIQ